MPFFSPQHQTAATSPTLPSFTRSRPIAKSWDDLNELQKIKISFLVLRQQQFFIFKHYCCNLPVPEANHKVAETLWNALDENTPCGQKLTAFVPKGGDVTIDTSETNSHYLANFLELYPLWNDNNQAPTTFNNPDTHFGDVEAFLGFQAETSSLCYLVAVVNAIYYSMSLQNGSVQSEASEQYTLNISQYQRNRFSHEEIFRAVFLGEGGPPRTALMDLLQLHNQSMDRSDLIRKLTIEGEHYDFDIGSVYSA
eukprot:scaffold1022_cov35-Attheya_sp.AAC.1